MGRQILILSGSPRRQGNTDLLCDEFMRGASETGHTVEKVSLAEKRIGFFTTDFDRQADHQKDDVAAILDKMLRADVIVLATPVYFYSLSAQLKALFDRSVAIYRKMQNKTFYYLLAMADTDPEMFAGTLGALRGFLACYDGSVEAGYVAATGVYGKGEVLKTDFPRQAYELGRSVQ